MIVDTLDNWPLYPYPAPWQKAFAFIAALSPDAADGEYPIVGREVFGIVWGYQTRPREDARYESHRKYMDIQTVLAGRESIACHQTDQLAVAAPYDDDRDIAFYRDQPARFHLQMPPGIFAALFPGDAHMPGLHPAETAAGVKKVVVKIALAHLFGR